MFRRWESSRPVWAAASLSVLARRVELHRKVLNLIRAELPEHIAQRCADCSAHEDGRLVLFAESPSWAFQLRFHAPAILAALNEKGYRYREIRVRNLPLRIVAYESPSAERPLCGQAVVDAVKACAASCASEELSKALSRLGATLAGARDGNGGR